MKTKLLALIFGMIFLMAIMPNLVSSEIMMWNTVGKDYDTSTVKYHAFYYFEDTSARGIGKNKDVPITLQYVVQALPYTLPSGNVDWCNFTIKQYKNIYGTTFVAFQGFFGGELLNTTTETQSLYFQNTSLSTDFITINMRDRDTLTATMTCHYTDPNYLYVENALIGRFTTYMPSFECVGCSQYTLEELSQQTEKNEATTLNELAIYDKIQTIINWNFQVWLIFSWIIKIAFVLIGIGLIFAIAYYFYVFLNNLAKET